MEKSQRTTNAIQTQTVWVVCIMDYDRQVSGEGVERAIRNGDRGPVLHRRRGDVNHAPAVHADNDAIHARRWAVERCFAWQDKLKRVNRRREH